MLREGTASRECGVGGRIVKYAHYPEDPQSLGVPKMITQHDNQL